MLMLWVTKVFHTGVPRVGRLTKHIVLPRSVPLTVVFAVPVGLLIGVFVGQILQSTPVTVIIPENRIVSLSAVVCGFITVLLVTVQPWRGEHVHRVVAVYASAYTATSVRVCPGSGMPSVHSDESGTLICGECGRIVGQSEQFVPEHKWRRRVYLGMKPITPPPTGEIMIIAGSVPTDMSSTSRHLFP